MDYGFIEANISCGSDKIKDNQKFLSPVLRHIHGLSFYELMRLDYSIELKSVLHEFITNLHSLKIDGMNENELEKYISNNF